MPFLETPTAKLYYETHSAESAAPWVTLINGHTRSSKDFKTFAQYLKKQGYSVLTFDNRGSGQTLNHSKAFTLSDMAQDVLRLWQALGIEKSHLLGISMGGILAQIISKQARDQIQSLALISTTGTIGTHLSSHKPWPHNIEGIKAKLAHYFSDSFVENNGPLLTAMAKNILQNIDQFQTNALAQRQAFAHDTFNEDMASYTDKALKCWILHGQEDKTLPPSHTGKLKERYPNAQIQLETGIGHLFIAERPKLLYEAYWNFLEEN